MEPGAARQHCAVGRRFQWVRRVCEVAGQQRRDARVADAMRRQYLEGTSQASASSSRVPRWLAHRTVRPLPAKVISGPLPPGCGWLVRGRSGDVADPGIDRRQCANSSVWTRTGAMPIPGRVLRMSFHERCRPADIGAATGRQAQFGNGGERWASATDRDPGTGSMGPAMGFSWVGIT